MVNVQSLINTKEESKVEGDVDVGDETEKRLGRKKERKRSDLNAVSCSRNKTVAEKGRGEEGL